MSTKITIAYGEHYHVYSECFEEDQSIYLRLDGADVQFEAYPNSINIRIPKDVMLAILDKSDEIHERFKAEDWNEVQEPQEWKKGE
jgi:hypothetical protein